MKFSEQKIKNWHSFYYNEGIEIISLPDFFNHIRLANSNPEYKVKATNLGIEFNCDNPFSMHCFNIYTLIAITKSLLINIKKRNKTLLLGHSEGIDAKIYELFKRSFSHKSIKLLEYNINVINEFIIINTTLGIDVDYYIYLYKNPFNNNYYIKIYHDLFLISVNEQKQLLNNVFEFDKQIILHNFYNLFILKIDKFLSFYKLKLENQKHLFLENQIDRNNLNIKIAINNPADNNILQSLLNSLGFNVKEASNLRIQERSKNLFWIFFKWNLFSYQKSKTDFLITSDKKNRYNFFFNINDRYIKINNEELIYFYINYFFLQWKNENKLQQNKVIITHSVSKNIINLLNNFNIPYEFAEKSDTKNVLFANILEHFGANNNQALEFSNLQFIINICQMLLSYKNNNNLLDYKYLKMRNYFKNTIYIVKKIKIPFFKSTNLATFFQVNQSISRNYRISKMEQLNAYNTYSYEFLNLEIQNKKQQVFNICIYYDFNRESLIFKQEHNFEYTQIEYYLNKFKGSHLNNIIIKYVKKYLNKQN
ncbi:MAG5620 family putative phospho-sugar mutase [Mycoplasma sp. 5912]